MHIVCKNACIKNVFNLVSFGTHYRCNQLDSTNSLWKKQLYLHMTLLSQSKDSFYIGGEIYGISHIQLSLPVLLSFILFFALSRLARTNKIPYKNAIQLLPDDMKFSYNDWKLFGQVRSLFVRYKTKGVDSSDSLSDWAVP